MQILAMFLTHNSAIGQEDRFRGRRLGCRFLQVDVFHVCIEPCERLGSPGGPLRLWAARAHLVSREILLRFDAPGRGFARIPLRFDAPAVVSREFPCVSTLPLWFRANSQAFRRSRRGFAPIPIAFGRSPLWCRAHSGLFWPALASSGGPLRLRATNGARGGARPSFAPAVVSREIPMRFDALPAVVRANSLAFRSSRLAACQ